MVGQWGIHWLEAEGSLLEWRAGIGAEIEAARRLLERHGLVVSALVVETRTSNGVTEVATGLAG